MKEILDLARWRRVAERWSSRSRDYAGLRAAGSVAEAMTWAAGRPLPFFNGNILRAKVAQALVESAGCRFFLETGTSHAATAIGARIFLDLPVWSCENSPRDFLISQAMTFGMQGISLRNLDSREFLRQSIPQLKSAKDTPFIYLDAHEGALDRTSLPLADEILAILQLESFVVLIDDFRVPGDSGFRWGTYGGVAIETGLLANQLGGAGINTCYFPSYAATADLGFPSGYCVFWRSRAADAAYQAGGFPLNLLRPFSLLSARSA